MTNFMSTITNSGKGKRANIVHYQRKTQNSIVTIFFKKDKVIYLKTFALWKNLKNRRLWSYM